LCETCSLLLVSISLSPRGGRLKIVFVQFEKKVAMECGTQLQGVLDRKVKRGCYQLWVNIGFTWTLPRSATFVVSIATGRNMGSIRIRLWIRSTKSLRSLKNWGERMVSEAATF